MNEWMDSKPKDQSQLGIAVEIENDKNKTFHFNFVISKKNEIATCWLQRWWQLVDWPENKTLDLYVFCFKKFNLKFNLTVEKINSNDQT